MKPFVSFVIIAYNEAGNIGRTLDAITSLDGLDRHEVIVVNDGSRDRTADIVADAANRNANIKLIDLPNNYGRGYARSTGITAAQGELIATVDADILLPRDWLILTLASLADHDAVGGTAVPDGDVAYVYQRTKLVPRVVGHTTAVTGSNALYRREVFDLVSFDPALREGEDVALNHASVVSGLSLATVPSLMAEHIENKTFAESLKWLFVTGRGATRQLLTYGQARTPDLATAAFLASVAAGLLVITIGHLVVGAAIPIALVLAASSQHIHSRFETPLKHWWRTGSAVAVDSSLLLAYFTGRVFGLSVLRHGWPRATQQGGLPGVRENATK